MLIHYLKLARKSLIKYKYYTMINIIGLVSGMMSALIIAKYIGASLESDNFHVNKNQIYALAQEQFANGNHQEKQNSTYPGMANLISRFSEASLFTTYQQHVQSLVISEKRNGNRLTFTEDGIFITDSSFLKVFTFPLIHGDAGTALSRPNSMVLTKAASQKYFGNVNPVGEILTVRVAWGKETSYQVTGVTEDIHQLSRFKFDFLISQQPINTDEVWYVPDCSIYLLLKEKTKPAALADKITSALKDVPQLKATNRTVIASLEAITSNKLLTEEYLLATVAIFIALICWVNYVNQIIAQSYWRIKEIGILRVMGATRTSVKMQFLVEAVLTCIVSLILIIGIYLGFEPFFQNFTDRHLLPLIGDPTNINVIFMGIFIAGVAVAATVQSIIHFSRKFGTTLQNLHSYKIGSIGLRQALVVLQFSISTVLMVSIFVIHNQLDYLNTKDKGVNLNDVLVIKAPMAKDTTWYAKRKTLEVFKQRCAELPFVVDVTSSTTIPGEEYRNEAYLSLRGTTGKALVHQNGVDEHFFSLYEAKFIAGHDFIPHAIAQNRNSIILNESAAKALGISDYDAVINAKVTDHNEPDAVYDLIGIIKDYHQTSMKYEMKPMAFKFNVFRGHCSLKIKKAAFTQSASAQELHAIEQIWKESYADAAFDYFFLDDRFEAQNIKDRQFGKLFRYFTFLSVIISCLGLFGLSLLISTKRQKEVGIRKTFGASTADILRIFLTGYIRPLSISLLIGSPIAYAMMNNWLQNYAYRIEIGIGLVALAVGTLILIFLFTVSYSTIKSAIANPISVLRE